MGKSIIQAGTLLEGGFVERSLVQNLPGGSAALTTCQVELDSEFGHIRHR